MEGDSNRAQGSRTIVALVGPRCSGKTSIGQELARRLGWTFVDLDDEVARLDALDRGADEILPAGEVLARLGEPAFRDIEERALRETVGRTGSLVLATGGGTVEREAARDLLARRATCVWLRVAKGELERRMRASPVPRPSLTGADPVEEIGAILERREPLYSSVAELTVDCRGLSVGEIAGEISRRLGMGTRSGCRS